MKDPQQDQQEAPATRDVVLYVAVKATVPATMGPLGSVSMLEGELQRELVEDEDSPYTDVVAALTAHDVGKYVAEHWRAA